MRLLVATLLVVALLAGCAKPAPSSNSSAQVEAPLVPADLSVLSGNTTKALPAAFGGGFHMAWKDTGFDGAEPNIGITPAGNAFITAFSTVIRSKDVGQTWEATVDRTVAPTTLDPMLWVDPATGRVFSNQLNVACAWLSWSDDEGDSWTPSPVSCGLPAIDHQKFASGPYSASSPLAPAAGNPLYPNHVSFCYNKIGGTFCAVSVDGGIHFVLDNLVDTAPIGPSIATDRSCGGINGHQKYAPDGTIYVPYGLNCGIAFVAVSTDSGVSWTLHRLGFPQFEADPFITVTSDGTAYYMWRDDTQRMKLIRSHDRFATFDGPFDITPPEVTGTMFAGLTAGSPGRIAWSFLGHTTPYTGDPPSATFVNATARWHLYAGMSLDADAAEPTFVTQRVTPADDPVQVGPIFEGGGGDPSRNLLDFIDMHTGPDGRPWIAFTDGCTSKACKTPDAKPSDSRDAQIAAAWMQSGPSLFADKPRLS